MRPAFEYRHVVTLEETNVIGNVYFANHVRWQGRCRELFLHTHAPAVIAQLGEGLAMVTTRVSCQYLAELVAFDEVIVRMRLRELLGCNVAMEFEYWRQRGNGEELVATGEQEVTCLYRGTGHAAVGEVPRALRDALQAYI